MNKAFVDQVKEIAAPADVLLVTCRSGGRGGMAVNQLAAAGFTNAYNIVDGIEGDTVDDPESVFHGKRMKNGWKNVAPWVYDVDPEKIIIEEGRVPRNAVSLATKCTTPALTVDGTLQCVAAHGTLQMSVCRRANQICPGDRVWL